MELQLVQPGPGQRANARTPQCHTTLLFTFLLTVVSGLPASAATATAGEVLLENITGQSITVKINYYNLASGSKVLPPIPSRKFANGDRAYLAFNNKRIQASKVSITVSTAAGSKSWVYTKKSGDFIIRITSSELPRSGSGSKPTTVTTPKSKPKVTPKPVVKSNTPAGDVHFSNKSGQTVDLEVNYYDDASGKKITDPNVTWKFTNGKSAYLAIDKKRLRASRISVAVKTAAGSASWEYANTNGGDLRIIIAAAQLPKKPSSPAPKTVTRSKTPVAGEVLVHNDTCRNVKFILRSYVASSGKTYAPNRWWDFKPGERAYITRNGRYKASRVDYTIRTKYGDKLWYMTNYTPGKVTVRVSKGDTARPFRLNYSDIALNMAKAKQGNAFAMGVLAEIFVIGLPGYPEDISKSAAWSSKAAKLNDPTGTYIQGLYAFHGMGGVRQSVAEGKRLYKRAAEMGHSNAEYTLGAMYWNGDKTRQDRATGYKWIARAAERGHPMAQRILGFMYVDGDYLKRDYSKAHYWLGKAGAQGDAAAMNDVGAMYEEGKGIRQSTAKAESWYHRAAALGNDDAVNNLKRLARNRFLKWFGPSSGSAGRDWYNQRGSDGLRGSDKLYLTNQANRIQQHGR